MASDGTAIVYTRAGRRPAADPRRAAPDRPVEAARGSNGEEYGAAVSRTGKLAFVSTRSGTPVVYVAQANGVGATPFDTTPPATPFTDVHDLAWSPDGTKLAYSADQARRTARGRRRRRHDADCAAARRRARSGRRPARESRSTSVGSLMSVAADGTDIRTLGTGVPLDWRVVPVGTPKFPNLVQRPPSQLVVSRGGNGHWLLGFTSMVDNRGPGIIWIRGTRAPGAHVMQVRQLVQLASGGVGSTRARASCTTSSRRRTTTGTSSASTITSCAARATSRCACATTRAASASPTTGGMRSASSPARRASSATATVRAEGDVRRGRLVRRLHRPLSRVLPRPAARHHEAAGRALLARPPRERGLPSARAALLGQRRVAPRPADVARRRADA